MNETERNQLAALRTWVGQVMRLSMHRSLLYARNHGLSMAHMVALTYIGHHGHCNVTDLAEVLGVSNPAASQMLDRLVQQGLITRQENPQDRRSKQLTLTEQGHKLLQKGLIARQRWLESLVTRLTPEEREQVGDAVAILIRKTSGLEQT